MKTININGVIGEVQMTRFHFGMLFWACFVITFDMYDLVIYGSALPVLMKEWHMTPVQAGAIGSYGFFGMMLGAVLFGILADRFGRKGMLVSSIVLFSVATTLCSFASEPVSFSIFRFLAGLGIGGILPTVIAMLSDYAPKRKANTFVAIVMCFFHVAGILAALIAMNFIPAFGWQSVYRVAILPIFFLPFMVKYFVNSPSMLLKKGRLDELRATLSKVNPVAEIP